MALSFNGTNQYVAFNDNTVFNTNSISIMGWVSPTALPSGMSVICSTNSVSAGYRAPFALYFTGGRLTAQITYANTFFIFTTYETVNLTSPNTIPVGRWAHVGMTFNNGELRLYENGREVAYANTGRTPVMGTTATVGADRTAANSFQGFYAGVLEDFRIYNRALSANEMLTISTLRGKDGILLNGVAQMAMNEHPNNTVHPAGAVVFNRLKTQVIGMAMNGPSYRDSFFNTLKRW